MSAITIYRSEGRITVANLTPYSLKIDLDDPMWGLSGKIRNHDIYCQLIVDNTIPKSKHTPYLGKLSRRVDYMFVTSDFYKIAVTQDTGYIPNVLVVDGELNSTHLIVNSISKIVDKTLINNNKSNKIIDNADLRYFEDPNTKFTIVNLTQEELYIDIYNIPKQCQVICDIIKNSITFNAPIYDVYGVPVFSRSFDKDVFAFITNLSKLHDLVILDRALLCTYRSSFHDGLSPKNIVYSFDGFHDDSGDFHVCEFVTDICY